MSIVMYITDYAVKHQLSTHSSFQLMATALRKLEQSEVYGTSPRPDLTNFNDVLRRTRALSIKCLSAFQGKVELGAPLVLSHLMGLPNHYVSHKFVPVYLNQLLSFVEQQHPDIDKVSDSEYVGTYSLSFNEFGAPKIVASFLTYLFRPAEFAHLSVHDFYITLHKVTNAYALSNGLTPYPLHSIHPQSETHCVVKYRPGGVCGCHGGSFNSTTMQQRRKVCEDRVDLFPPLANDSPKILHSP